jgi:DNA-binding MarR family transcriptional regulator
MRDEVDDVADAWRRERPELDLAPLEVMSRVTRLARHLDRARSEACARHDLDVWEFDVLAALRRSGAPYELSAGSLVRQTLVTSGTMTNRIDRLEERGLVARRRDPGDGRAVIIRLRARGRRAVDAALTDLLDLERGLLAGLTAAQQAALAGSLRALLAPLRWEPTPDKS